jgi:predicted glycogen debranching enzyme
MISLEGLSLSTGRFSEARWILKSFSHYVNQGLIPNMFPEGKNEGLYHTVDATLWFFHAIDRYVSMTQDFLTLEELLPILNEIIDWHIKGTLFSIGMDSQDYLIKAGAEGYQLTWMDAKVGDWVVTPRRGKPVEINALWYNALKLMEEWTSWQGDLERSAFFGKIAQKSYDSFNQRFWIFERGYLFDVIDGEKQKEDPAFRPNQLFAISLKYPVLERTRWESVVKQCKEKLLTPYGLRTLSSDHPDFKARYGGDLRSRDAAYHQGTVWPWLIGPFIDAWLKVYPEDHSEARRFLGGLEKHLSEPGIGSIHEIFDAVEPFAPQGCMAQAWSVSETLRCWIKTAI